MKTQSQKMYDNLASGYREYSGNRGQYIDTINNIVREYIRPHTSLIDFGAGDGVRVHDIVQDTNVSLCMVENSDNMVSEIKRMWPNSLVINKDISSPGLDFDKKFDVAICLWNVLGHLGNRNQVLSGIKNIKKSIHSDGVIILDINNRHNISQYGCHAVRNIFKDLFNYNFCNGDIKFQIKMSYQIIPSFVHIFSKSEIENIFADAGLEIKRKVYVNYATGKLHSCWLRGQLCYVLGIQK